MPVYFINVSRSRRLFFPTESWNGCREQDLILKRESMHTLDLNPAGMNSLPAHWTKSPNKNGLNATFPVQCRMATLYTAWLHGLNAIFPVQCSMATSNQRHLCRPCEKCEFSVRYMYVPSCFTQGLQAARFQCSEIIKSVCHVLVKFYHSNHDRLCL